MTKNQHLRKVAQNVMLARAALGLKPFESAAKLGITQQQLWNVETGRNYPAPTAIVAACEELGFTADWFYRGIRAGTASEVADKLRQAEGGPPPIPAEAKKTTSNNRGRRV